MAGLVQKARSSAPFLSSTSTTGNAARSVSVSATWDNCAASSPVLRSPNALVFSTRLALVNQGLMAARDHVDVASSPKNTEPQGSNVTHAFALTHGSATVSVRRLQRKCVLSVELASKTVDEMAAVRAVFRSVTELLGANREPIVAMQTGRSVA